MSLTDTGDPSSLLGQISELKTINARLLLELAEAKEEINRCTAAKNNAESALEILLNELKQEANLPVVEEDKDDDEDNEIELSASLKRMTDSPRLSSKRSVNSDSPTLRSSPVPGGTPPSSLANLPIKQAEITPKRKPLSILSAASWTTLAGANQKKSEERKELEHSLAELAQANKIIMNLKAEASQLRTETAGHRDMANLLETYQTNNSLLQEKLEKALSANDSLSNQVQTLTNQIEDFSLSKYEYDANISELKQINDDQTRLVTSLEEKLLLLNSENTKLRHAQGATLQEISDLKAAVIQLQVGKDSIMKSLIAADEDKATLQKTLKAQQESWEELLQSNQSSSTQSIRREDENHVLTLKNTTLQEEKDILSTELKATTKLLDETRSILATERDERKELLAKKDELEQM
jgi:hypothetical protein